MQEKVGEQGAAYIPMPKGRGFTPHFGKPCSVGLFLLYDSIFVDTINIFIAINQLPH